MKQQYEKLKQIVGKASIKTAKCKFNEKGLEMEIVRTRTRLHVRYSLDSLNFVFAKQQKL